MKNFFLLVSISTLLTSCTCQDVIDYLCGKQNGLCDSEKKQVEENKNNTEYIIIARDRDYGRPK